MGKQVGSAVHVPQTSGNNIQWRNGIEVVVELKISNINREAFKIVALQVHPIETPSQRLEESALIIGNT